MIGRRTLNAHLQVWPVLTANKHEFSRKKTGGVLLANLIAGAFAGGAAYAAEPTDQGGDDGGDYDGGDYDAGGGDFDIGGDF